MKLELLGVKTKVGSESWGHHQMPRAPRGGSCVEQPCGPCSSHSISEDVPGPATEVQGTCNPTGCCSHLPTWLWDLGLANPGFFSREWGDSSTASLSRDLQTQESRAKRLVQSRSTENVSKMTDLRGAKNKGGTSVTACLSGPSRWRNTSLMPPGW